MIVSQSGHGACRGSSALGGLTFAKISLVSRGEDLVLWSLDGRVDVGRSGSVDGVLHGS